MGFLSSIFKKPNRQPQDHYKVIVTEEGVKVYHPEQTTQSVLWEDLTSILLINTDKGPFQPDVWLTLISNKSRCLIPQGAQGFETVFDIVSKYEGFDFNNFIKSMSCAGNAEFLLWTKKS